jgi:hypothetical protein
MGVFASGWLPRLAMGVPVCHLPDCACQEQRAVEQVLGDLSADKENFLLGGPVDALGYCCP